MDMTPQPFDFSSAYRQLADAERVFCDAYVSDLERAAHKTGDKLQAVLERQTVPQNDARAADMLGRALVRAAIVERVKDLTEEIELSEFKTLKELRCIAYSNFGDYMTPGFDYLDLDFSKCTPEQLAAIKSFDIQENDRTGSRKVKFQTHDKLKALELLMKHQGLLDDEKWKDAKRADDATQIVESDTSEDAADKWARRIAS